MTMTTYIQGGLPITEQPDCRPAEGEYFSPRFDPDRISDFYGYEGEACFVCGKDLKDSHGFEADAIVQCQAAGQRVAQLFGKEARLKVCLYHGSITDGHAGVRIKVCRAHRLYLPYLLRLAADDGVITLERIDQVRHSGISLEEEESNVINQERFHRLTSIKAFELWSARNWERSCQNWNDVWEELRRGLGHIPSRAQRKARAEELHRQRKEWQALQDWLDAEKDIAKFYTIAP